MLLPLNPSLSVRANYFSGFKRFVNNNSIVELDLLKLLSFSILNCLVSWWVAKTIKWSNNLFYWKRKFLTFKENLDKESESFENVNAVLCTIFNELAFDLYSRRTKLSITGKSWGVKIRFALLQVWGVWFLSKTNH